jgi:hypothetical protein
MGSSGGESILKENMVNAGGKGRRPTYLVHCKQDWQWGPTQKEKWAGAKADGILGPW